jgi:hypothetical protein
LLGPPCQQLIELRPSGLTIFSPNTSTSRSAEVRGCC